MIPYDWGDRMVGPLGEIVSPFRPNSRIEGGDRTTTLRRRDVGAVLEARLQSHVQCRMQCDAIDHIQTQTFHSPRKHTYDETVATRNQVKYRKQFINRNNR